MTQVLLFSSVVRCSLLFIVSSRVVLSMFCACVCDINLLTLICP